MDCNKRKRPCLLSKYYKRAKKHADKFGESSRSTTNEFSRSSSTTDKLSELSNFSLTNNVFENYELLPSSSDSEQSEEGRASSSLREGLADNYGTENISQNTLGIPEGKSESNQNNFAYQNADPSQQIETILVEWFIKYNIPHVAASELLNNLNTFFPHLPIDSRSLLHTSRTLTIHSIEPGNYYHFGFKNCILKLISCSRYELTTSIIEVFINIDGLPLSKSSGSQLYPILCRLSNNNSVGVIGIYHGYEKPKDANSFLKMFADEAVEIVQTGIMFKENIYKVEIRGFICDVPAKSYVKYTIGHCGYFSCSKCEIEGNYHHNKICFPQTENLTLRNDSDFRSKKQEAHHMGTSVLELIPNVDMIKHFPLDYMHLVCLGVVKKMIVNLWLNGKPPCKLSFHQASKISESILSQIENIPKEFNRKPRSLNDAKRWKATEFRMFLLYVGPVVLKNNIDSDKYKHFISLHYSMMLLSSYKSHDDIEYAKELLKYFVKSFIILYGAENVSHNIHNLLHISDDVKHFGPLDSFSAFPFENHMQYFKKFVRKGEKPLQQIVKRINEQDCVNITCKSESFPKLWEEHFMGPTLNLMVKKQYKKLFNLNFMLSVSEPNNCCVIEEEIIVIKNIVVDGNDEIMIIGQTFQKKTNFYSTPSSSDVGIYLVDDLGPLLIWNVKKLSYKCLKLDFHDKNVIFPLLHMK